MICKYCGEEITDDCFVTGVEDGADVFYHLSCWSELHPVEEV